MELIGFIPCRGGSERVKDKNTRPFAGFVGGLLELKLRQLALVPQLARIVVSSNDPIALDYAQWFAVRHDSRVKPVPRPEHYGISATSMEAFIRDYIAHLEPDGAIFWSHVTHPFLTASIYSGIIDAYAAARARGHDCLVTVTRLQRFLWKDGKPFNYDNTREKWPRSQDLEPVQEINHGVYAIPFATMRECGDRIGRNPCFHELPEQDTMDIDWQEQFDLMEEIALARLRQGSSLL